MEGFKGELKNNHSLNTRCVDGSGEIMWNESRDLLLDSNGRMSRVCVCLCMCAKDTRTLLHANEMWRVLPLNSFMHRLIDQHRSIDLLNMEYVQCYKVDTKSKLSLSYFCILLLKKKKCVFVIL